MLSAPSALRCSGRGTYDAHRGVCECPLGYEGRDCAISLLPACEIGGGRAIPIRSWVLHEFHNRGSGERWRPRGEAVGIGPVPCECLRQLVAAPFLLERSRMIWLHRQRFEVRCVRLPPDTSLADLLARPSVGENLWRRFSFGAAYEALRAGVEPALDGAPLDDARPARLARLLRRARRRADGRLECGGAGCAGFDSAVHPLPPLLGASPAAALPNLLPLSECGGCGGVGWCERAAAATAKPRCGCFVPGGLVRGVGGPRCADARVWRPSRQPVAHWGPLCPLDCSGRGACDWQGFCRCDAGYWGVDCGETSDGDRPVLALALGGGERRARRAEKPRAPRVYVLPMPPHLRFGVDFSPKLDELLTERLLKSAAHRAASADEADYFWCPGPPLVIDGHRLLARLWHVRERWPAAWNRTAGLPRLMLALLTERASMDSFQLSYTEDDREEWPALASAPHVRGLVALLPRCAARPAAAARDADDAAGGADALSAHLHALRERRSAPLLRALFGGGGYQEKGQRGCRLPADFAAASPTRAWLGVQFNGNTRPPVFFARGVDVAVPQLQLAKGGGSHADQQSCDAMNASSPWSAHFRRAALAARRPTLLWFGGHGGHGDARTEMLRRHAREPGFELVDTNWRNPNHGVARDAVNMTLTSRFCWVPRGQGQGDPTRHMVAIFHGCVPVFSLAPAGRDDALPFDELIDWRTFSVVAPTDRLADLPSTLRSIAASEPRLAAMRGRLRCAWRLLFWSSLVGACFGEPARGDAFDALMAVLRRRLRRLNGAAPRLLDPCDATVLPPHLRVTEPQ